MFVDIVERGRSTGQATRHKDAQLFLHRHGYVEECYVTYTFVPLLGQDKTVVGFYHTAIETTSQVLSNRRTKTLLAIGHAATASRSLQEYWQNLIKTLETHNDDMPWAVAYSFARDNVEAQSASGTDSSAGSSSPGRALTSCSLAGVIGRAITQVPLSFDYRKEGDPFVRTIRKPIQRGETIVLHCTDPALPPLDF